jgi:hypothetical protein
MMDNHCIHLTSIAFNFDSLSNCLEVLEIFTVETSFDKVLSKYMLDLVAVQVTWEGGSTEPAGEYTFFYGKGNDNH